MSNYTINGGELYHYGVLGMKWGVRRGRATQAYERASKKLAKLDKKLEKKMAKSDKASAKADRKLSSAFASQKSYDKAVFKAQKKQAKIDKSLRKAKNWYENMEKTFKDTDVSMTAEHKAMGKRYVEQFRTRSQLKYIV